MQVKLLLLDYDILKIRRLVSWSPISGTAVCGWSWMASFAEPGGISIFFAGLQGIERYHSEQGIQFNGVQTKAHSIRVAGKLGFGEPPMLANFRYL